MKKILNEISSIDAWNRFYKDRIPESAYNALMKSTKKMTPFHKLVLDKYIKEIEKPLGYGSSKEDAIESLNMCIKAIGDMWPSIMPDAKQALIEDAADGDFDNAPVSWISSCVQRYSQMRGFSENHYADIGLRVLYESDKLKVTCTTTYGANKKYYGTSHWCTASDMNGQYNGFLMFKRYTNSYDDSDELDADLCLLQFILSKDEIYQGQFDEDGSCEYAADYEDHEIATIVLREKIYSIGENYDTIIDNIDFKELIDETDRLRDVEDRYWGRKLAKQKNKFRKECIQKAQILIKKRLPELIEIAKKNKFEHNERDWLDLDNLMPGMEGVDNYFWLYVNDFTPTLNNKYYFLSMQLDYKETPSFLEEDEDTSQFYSFLLDNEYNLVKQFDANVNYYPKICGNFVIYVNGTRNNYGSKTFMVFDTNKLDYLAINNESIFDGVEIFYDYNKTRNIFFVKPFYVNDFYIFNAVNGIPVAVSKFYKPGIVNGKLKVYFGDSYNNNYRLLDLAELGLESLNESLNMFKKLLDY